LLRNCILIEFVLEGGKGFTFAAAASHDVIPSSGSFA